VAQAPTSGPRFKAVDWHEIIIILLLPIMQLSSPPSYHDDLLELESEPPAYTGQGTSAPLLPTHVQRAPKEFTYDLTSPKGKPWAILTVLGDPVLSKQLPSFREGRNITGSVKLSLESRDSIRAVSISVSIKIECDPVRVQLFLCVSLRVTSSASKTLPD
jgi:hypothetical protein